MGNAAGAQEAAASMNRLAEIAKEMDSTVANVAKDLSGISGSGPGAHRGERGEDDEAQAEDFEDENPLRDGPEPALS
jgi:hypothetical protein